ncbi:MAG: GNAT family N-acetyltransferase, partial [Deltaproteobacteria bacterium]|nr:GNAT family N-acetyltransferase [Deltaproteobacteria bacterium]
SSDTDLALALWGEPQVARFLHAAGPPPASAIEARLALEIASQADAGMQYWPIFSREDGAHVGCCGLHLETQGGFGRTTPRWPERGRVLELGFHLRPEHWGRGLATEASRAVIAYAFDRLGAAAVFAGHHPDNEGSRATLRKLGFRYVHHELYAPTGLQHPCYLLER